jgi:dienelactone hydrolase
MKSVSQYVHTIPINPIANEISLTTSMKGTIHSGQPKGTRETIHGLDTYVIGNRTNPKATIVIYSDVFGIPLPNNRLIADAYAASGDYLVYLPDFFEGDPLALKIADVLIPAKAKSTLGMFTGMLANMPGFLMWQSRHKAEKTDQVCVSFLQKLRRATPASQKIGMVGMCWGGKYALRAGRECNVIALDDGTKTPLVDAVVVLHPSNLVLPADVENIVVPFSCGWGEHDIAVPLKQKEEIEKYYAEAKKAGKKVPELEHKIYRPGRHGFSVRGNPNVPEERACLEQSEKQVLEWFGRWL